MRDFPCIAMLLLALAGCSIDSQEGAQPNTHTRASGLASHAADVKSRSGVAALPDRGELLAYVHGPAIPAAGAYGNFPVRLSEAHALSAIATGELRLRAPDGRILRLRYERHAEHPNGDWTWVGRLPGEAGEEAIITFGERAVYGSIPQGGGRLPLRLTMDTGRPLLVATDPRLAAAPKRPLKPDYFVPPRTAWDGVHAVRAEAPSVAAVAATAAAPTVDVLLGYTPGFRDSPAIGGDSQARTRLTHLVEIANQALSNSQLGARFRLVHAMLVDYPDATDNGTALEELTGYRAPSTVLTPGPEFTALRAARDQYGADLVSLVRRFRTPENDGCGIAWLIGGGRSGIGNGSDYFGYSIVSDGTDADTSGTTYYCRDETLAHEFGHNLGSQHDLATARGDDGTLDDDEYGRFDYSFGYKTTAGAGNFYTVMAYGDANQVRNRVFSNPHVAICGPSPGGYPCGVENQADNARSIEQTAPVIADFRAGAALPGGMAARNDVDGDGKSDLLWSRSGQFVAWRMDGSRIAGTRSYAVGTSFKALGSGDVDGNGYVDVVWLDTLNGDIHAWLGQATGSYVSRLVYRLGNSWTLVGSGDVNGDGKDDLLWSRPATGQFAYWLMNGGSILGSRGFAVSNALIAIGTGDLDGNGRADVLWRDGEGAIYAWLGTSAGGYDNRFVYKLATSWKLAGTGDINGDARDDLLWSRPASSQFVHWLMDGAMINGSSSYTINSAFSAIGSGDFDGNDRTDVVWRNGTGDIYFWLRQTSSYSSQFVYRLTGWTLLP